MNTTLKRIFLAACLSLPLIGRAQTAQTRAALYNEIVTDLPSNSQNLITAAVLRQVLNDLTASATNPLTDGTPVLGFSGTAVQGDILYFNGTNWVPLIPAVAGQFLETAGAGANPFWGTPSVGLTGLTNTWVVYGTGPTTYGSNSGFTSSSSGAIGMLSLTITSLTSNGPLQTSGSTGAVSVGTLNGTGNISATTNPVFVTPTLGAALATSINGLTISTSTGTLTVANGSSLITSGGFAATITSTATTNSTLPAGTTTLAQITNAQTFAGVQTFSSNPTLSAMASAGIVVNSAAGALTSSNGPSITGSYTSTVATGTAPLVVSSTTLVANLTAASLAATGQTWVSPGAIGTTTPAAGNFTTIGVTTVGTAIFTTLQLNGTNATTAETLAPVARTSGSLPYAKWTIPTDTGLATTVAAPGWQILTGSRQWTAGTVANQIEDSIAAPTYTQSGAGTFTQAVTMALSGAPISGTNAAITTDIGFLVSAGAVNGAGTAPVTAIAAEFLNPTGASAHNYAMLVGTLGNGITNIRYGTSAALVLGVSAAITDTGTSANTRYIFTTHTIGTVTLPQSYYASTRTANTSFVITSSNATDTSTVDWVAFEP